MEEAIPPREIFVTEELPDALADLLTQSSPDTLGNSSIANRVHAKQSKHFVHV